MNAAAARSDLQESLVKFEDVMRRVEEEAARIRRVLALNIHRLATEGTASTQNVLFSVCDLAALVNTASRWEGRTNERLEVAYEAELAEKGGAT